MASGTFFFFWISNMVSLKFPFSVRADEVMLGAEPLHWGLWRLLVTAHKLLTGCFKEQRSLFSSTEQSHQNGSTMLCCCFHWGPCQVASVEMLRGFISLTCHTARCTPGLPVKLCCFCWDAVCALLGLLVVPDLTFNFPVFWTAQTHCCHCMCSLILLSSHSAPFHSWDISMLYLEISSRLGKKKMWQLAFPEVQIFSLGVPAGLSGITGPGSHSGQLHLDAAVILLSTGTCIPEGFNHDPGSFQRKIHRERNCGKETLP